MSDLKITVSLFANAMRKLKSYIKKTGSYYVPFSVPVSAWTASAHGSFNFSADVSIATIKATDSGRVDFSESSIEAAMDAGVITGSTADGIITLRAQKKPVSALSGVCIIVREATV